MDGVRRRGERGRLEVRAVIIVRSHVVIFVVIRIVAGRLLVEVVVFLLPGVVIFRVAVAITLVTDFSDRHIELRNEGVAIEIGSTGTVERCLERARGGGEVAVGEWACGSCTVDFAGPVNRDAETKIAPVPAEVSGVNQGATAAV